MTRKVMIAAVTIIALTMAVFSLNAEAQDQEPCTYDEVIADTTGQCGALEYPGFTPPPTPTSAPVVPTPAPSATADAAAGNAANIAFTGSESTALASLGMGLVGLGAYALGLRRKVTHRNSAD